MTEVEYRNRSYPDIFLCDLYLYNFPSPQDRLQCRPKARAPRLSLKKKKTWPPTNGTRDSATLPDPPSTYRSEPRSVVYTRRRVINNKQAIIVFDFYYFYDFYFYCYNKKEKKN